jgi:predicted nucleic acid-binding protein
VIVVDTSALIDSLSGSRRSAPRLRAFLEAGERLVMPSLVLYEWRRGPRREEELAAQEGLLPAAAAVSFDGATAQIAARLYQTVARSRGREIDLAIAAHALQLEAALWTLNREDFSDIPGLALAPVR